MGDENQYIYQGQVNNPIHRFLKRIGRRFAAVCVLEAEEKLSKRE
jgi:hypothetical protein